MTHPTAPVGLGPKPRLAKRQTTPPKNLRHEVSTPQPEPQKQPALPWRSLVLMLGALAGIAISIYTCILHFAHVAPICSDSGVINCEKVLTSPQSVFLGIPVPLYGLAFFLLMLTVCTPYLWRTTHLWIPWTRLCLSALGIVFALDLVYQELFVIHSLCLWCTAAHLLAFAIFILIVTGWEDACLNLAPPATTP